MGCKIGVQYSQRSLEVALADVADIASGYVDDILIGTRRDNQTDSTKDLILKHDREVRLVMEQLLKHRLHGEGEVVEAGVAQRLDAVVRLVLQEHLRQPQLALPLRRDRLVGGGSNPA